MDLKHPSGQWQRFEVADLTRGGDDRLLALMDGHAASVVYSDPPWNPGNEKYWRRYAGEDPPTDYRHLLDAWCKVASSVGADHIVVEQSVNPAHRGMLMDAVARCATWTLALRAEWVALYGSPRRPNMVMHFGVAESTTDPTDMYGDAMVRTVLRGLSVRPGGIIVDPCMGLGTTSRMAHEFGCHCVGTELNAARLERTVAWLRKKGYA